MNDEVLFKEKTSKRKKLWIALGVFGVVIVALVGIVFYLASVDLKQEDLLKQEVVNLSNKRLDEDDFSINVVTKGDYAYVEEAVKKFYLELSNNIKNIKTIFTNQEFIQVLSADNIASDGPYFTKSLTIIDNAIQNVKESMNNIIYLCSEEAVLELLDKNKVDDYYIDFYKELMLTDSDKEDLNATKEKMTNLSIDVEEFLNKAKEILLMLKSNNGSWSISDGQLYFTTNDLVDTYNNLYNELRDKANKIQEYYKVEDKDNSSNNKENVA